MPQRLKTVAAAYSARREYRRRLGHGCRRSESRGALQLLLPYQKVGAVHIVIAVGVLRILRRAMREPALAIAESLAAALVDSYHREDKTSRAYARKKTDAPGTAPPLILTATKAQTRLARQIKRLTA